GKLRHGKEATIKVVSAESKHGAQEFLTEIKVVSDIEHENLANLIGYCVGGNIITLVYVYIENNSSSQPLLAINNGKDLHMCVTMLSMEIIKDSDLEELREVGSGTFGTVYPQKWREIKRSY
nr:cold-responsive protein kinase 1 [Tanacetum cinerariifolium]GEX95958.1 cold-responsive protein kinase 1 [Tanacetum cinerariifolium]